MKKNKGVMTLIHVVIGIAITLLVANLTPPEPLTRYGLTVIGLFVVTNYWFATIGMIWPSVLSLALYVILTATPAAMSRAVMLLWFPTCHGMTNLLCGVFRRNGFPACSRFPAPCAAPR